LNMRHSSILPMKVPGLHDQRRVKSTHNRACSADLLGLAMRSLSLITVVMWVMVPVDLTALVPELFDGFTGPDRARMPLWGGSSRVRVESLLDPWIALEVGVDNEAVIDVEHVHDAILQNAIS